MSKRDERRSCGTCRFWYLPLTDDLADCRRRAPIALPPDGEALWPVTRRDFWCGEWEPAP
jgi:hypothetical protein